MFAKKKIKLLSLEIFIILQKINLFFSLFFVIKNFPLGNLILAVGCNEEYFGQRWKPFTQK